MSEALDRIRDLRRAGFSFLAHRDDGGEVTTLQAVRIRVTPARCQPSRALRTG